MSDKRRYNNIIHVANIKLLFVYFYGVLHGYQLLIKICIHPALLLSLKHMLRLWSTFFRKAQTKSDPSMNQKRAIVALWQKSTPTIGQVLQPRHQTRYPHFIMINFICMKWIWENKQKFRKELSWYSISTYVLLICCCYIKTWYLKKSSYHAYLFKKALKTVDYECLLKTAGDKTQGP